MDPFKLLKEDHKRVKGLFREFEGAGDEAYKTKERIAQTVFEELAVHEQIEEEIFYPAIKAKASEEGAEIVLEGYEEHHVMDVLIGVLKEMSVEEENYDAKFKVLTENIEYHIEEEVGEMFQEARKALGESAGEVGERMAELKEELTGTVAGKATS